MFSDINLGQIEDDKRYNFIHKFDEDHEVFADNFHSCEYYEIENMKNNFLQHKDGFSTYSHNIRSINGHWDDVLDIIDSSQPLNFSVIAFQKSGVYSEHTEYLGMENLNSQLVIKMAPLTLIVVEGWVSLWMKNSRIMKY